MNLMVKKESRLLAAIFVFIFFVEFALANPSLEGFECTGGNKWKIAKFERIFCYTRVRAPVKNEGVISNNYCKQIDGAAHPASIHSLAENSFLERVFVNGFIGLFQPGYGPYNPGIFRWEDGTPLNFVHWDRGFHLKPQPNNDRPIERLTRLRKNRKFSGWHDWIANQIDYVICKKPATKIAHVAAPPAPATPKPAPIAPVPIPKPSCTETAVCSHGFIAKKNCGRWFCYRDYANIPREWRGYWGVTHVCEWTWPGSHAVSIHCKEENDWTKARFLYFFTGLYIPEGLPWAPWLFRWTDGTPVNFADWAPPGHGSPFQQPHNDVPIERVVDFTNHWHDTISNNPVTNRILCKRNPVRIDRRCPTPKPAPKPTTPAPKTTGTKAPSEILLETLPPNDVPVIVPRTQKPPRPRDDPPKPPPRSCRVN